jgi:type IV secretory pathway VirB2 component (pilin)
MLCLQVTESKGNTALLLALALIIAFGIALMARRKKP